MFHCCRRPAKNDSSGKMKPTIRQCLHLRRQGIAKDMEQRAPEAPSFQSQLAAYHLSDGAVHVRHRSMQPRGPFNMDSPTCCGQELRTQNHVQRMNVMIYANRTRRDTIIYHEAIHSGTRQHTGRKDQAPEPRQTHANQEWTLGMDCKGLPGASGGGRCDR